MSGGQEANKEPATAATSAPSDGTAKSPGVSAPPGQAAPHSSGGTPLTDTRTGGPPARFGVPKEGQYKDLAHHESHSALQVWADASNKITTIEPFSDVYLYIKLALENGSATKSDTFLTPGVILKLDNGSELAYYGCITQHGKAAMFVCREPGDKTFQMIEPQKVKSVRWSPDDLNPGVALSEITAYGKAIMDAKSHST